MLGEELFDRGTECIKEIALYTPSGAALLSQVTVLPAEVTHLMFIFCCPLIVILVKRHVEHKAAIREASREAVREKEKEEKT